MYDLLLHPMLWKICYQLSYSNEVITYVAFLLLHVCTDSIWVWEILKTAFFCCVHLPPCWFPPISCPLDQAPTLLSRGGDSRGTGSGRHQRGWPRYSGQLLCRHSCCVSLAHPVATCILQSTWRYSSRVPLIPGSPEKKGTIRLGTEQSPGLFFHFYCLDTMTSLFWDPVVPL